MPAGADARAEHLATRSAAGLFDFSFMEMCEVSGPQARAYLERLQTRNLSPLAPGRVFYTLGGAATPARRHHPFRQAPCCRRRAVTGV